MHKTVRAIIFDFDGLMVETEKISTRAWEKIAEEYGITIDDTYYSRARGTNYEGGRNVFLDMYGEDMPYDRIKAEKQAFFNEDVEKNGIERKKGLDELLVYAQEHGIRMAIASGSSVEYVRRCSKIAGIKADFDVIIGGEMVKKGKPDPEVFRMASERLGIPAENCLVLEDSINGAEAAINGGFQIIVVPDSVEPPEELVRRISAKYDDLIGVTDYLG